MTNAQRTIKAYSNALRSLCATHRTRHYFEEDGLIGVFNHAYDILWYRYVRGSTSGVSSCSFYLEGRTKGSEPLGDLKAVKLP